MDCSTPGFPVHHQLPELAQTHVHRVSDAIQPSHPLSSPPPAFSLSQHQGLFQWVTSSYQVVKVLELQHQSLTNYLRRHLVHWNSGVTTEPCHLFQRTLSLEQTENPSKDGGFRDGGFRILNVLLFRLIFGFYVVSYRWAFLRVSLFWVLAQSLQ